MSEKVTDENGDCKEKVHDDVYDDDVDQYNIES